MQTTDETIKILESIQTTYSMEREEYNALAIAQAWGKRIEVLQSLIKRIEASLPTKDRQRIVGPAGTMPPLDAKKHDIYPFD